MEPLVAVYDACVLYSNFLRDFMVRLAIHGRYQGVLRVKWTGRIHGEWIRAVLRDFPGVERTALLRTRRLMDRHIRGCRVHGYKRWEQRLNLPDPDDRHVVAAALACVADVIVTMNVSDFPASVLSAFGITTATPDVFVVQLAESGIVASAAADHRASLKRPPMTVDAYVDRLRRNGMAATATYLAGCAF
jgi:hypothetical protein